MSATLYLAHQVPGRVRLRPAAVALSIEALAALVSDISQLPGIVSCKARPATCSLIVVHDGDFGAIAQEAATNGVFQLAEPPEPRPIGLIAEEGLAYADIQLRELSRGQWDLRSSLGTLLLLLALVQLARGQLVGPFMTLLLQSIDLLAGRR